MLKPTELFEATLRTEGVQAVHDCVSAGFQSLIAVPVDKLMHFGDARSVWILQTGAAALFPVFDHIEAHLTGPAHAAFHEAEVEAGIAAHETAEENAARKRMVRFGEVADVVVGKVGDGGAVLPTAPARAAGPG